DFGAGVVPDGLQIANLVVDALPANLDVSVTPQAFFFDATLTVYDSSAIGVDDDDSFLNFGITNNAEAVQIIAPSGNDLRNQSQLTVLLDENVLQTVTFLQQVAGVPATAGPNEVLFTLGDSSTDIANRLFAVLSDIGATIVDGTTDELLLIGDEAVIRSSIIPVEFSAAMDRNEVAIAVARVAPGVLQATVDGDGRVSFLAATNIQVDETIQAGRSAPVLTGDQAVTIITPTGDQAASGEQLEITFGDGSVVTLQYVRTANATVGATDEILFDSGDTKADVGQQIVDLLPAGTASVDFDGNVSIVDRDATVNVIAAPASYVIDQAPPGAERMQIILRDGDEINDDEFLTIVDNFTDFIVAFDDGDGIDDAGLAADVILSYTDATTAEELAIALLPQLPVGLNPVLSGDTIRINVGQPGTALPTATQRPNLFEAQDADAVQIKLPTANGLIDGEQLTITIDGQAFVITFNDAGGDGTITGVDGTGTVVYNGPLTAGANTNLPEILRRFAEVALPSSVNVTGFSDSVVIYGAQVEVTDPVAGSNIQIFDLDALEITVPTGEQLNDRDTISVTVGTIDDPNLAPLITSRNFTLRDRDTAPVAVLTDPDVFAFDRTETEVQVRDNLIPRLSPFAMAVEGETNRIFTVGDDYAEDIPASSVTFELDPTVTITFPDPEELRTGDQLAVSADGAQATLTFVRVGSSLPDDDSIQIFFTEGSTGNELAGQIVSKLTDLFPTIAVSVLNEGLGDGFGINVIGAASAVVQTPVVTFITAESEGSYAVPITLPAGGAIDEGETITIYRKDDPIGSGQTYRFTTNPVGPFDIGFTTGMTPAEVAESFIASVDPALLPTFFGTSGREVLVSAAQSILTQPDSAIVSYEAIEDTGINFSPTRSVPVIIDATMDSDTVAQRTRLALIESLGRLDSSFTGVFEATAGVEDWKISGGDRIRLFNLTDVATDAYGVNEDFGDGLPMPGVEFGVGFASEFATSLIFSSAAINIEFAGFYLDDVVVGFAERGEMVIYSNYLDGTAGPPSNTDFVLDPSFTPDSRSPGSALIIDPTDQPENPDEILVGAYSLEIRTADEFGVPQDYDPINLVLDESVSAGRSFDTNDRLADGAVSLIAPAGSALIDGDRFVLDDGTNRVTFEFDNRFDPGVATSHVPVVFDATDTAAEVARAIRNAINSDQAQDTLLIVAATGDSRDIGESLSTSSRVELFGENIFVNPGSGRSLKLDLVAEETFSGLATARRVPLVNHDEGTVEYVQYFDELAGAAVPGYVDGDTLVASGKIGDAVQLGIFNNVSADDGAVIFNEPTVDFDAVRVYLTAGSAIDIDVDTIGLDRGAGGLELPVINVIRTGKRHTAA
ncbi:MAG: peptidase, partial [Planctomycetota bacterium]